MDLLTVCVTLIVIGLLLYLAFTYIPMAAPFKQIITAVVVIVVVLWLLQVFGLIGSLTSVRIR